MDKEAISMKKGKKAQITMFMIVGIVILIGASFLFYFNSKKADKVSAPITTQTGDFESYIKTCLSNSAEDNLILLGKQGGLVYSSQDGWFPDFKSVQKGELFIADGTAKVPYLLGKPFGSIDGGNDYSSDGQKYPWNDFPKLPDGSTTELGYFGVNKMISLNKIPLYPDIDSVQGSLEKLILLDMNNCKLDVFGKSYDITAGEPKVKVSFNNSVLINLEYGIALKDFQTGAKKTFDNFTISFPINFRKMYQFTSDIINKDATNISFDISNASTADFSVIVKRNAVDSDDLITVVDRKGKIDGKPYEFKFARKNRLPALGMITPIILDYTNPLSQQIRPGLFDPDEDDVAVTYRINGQEPVDDKIIPAAECGSISALLVNITDGEYNDWQILRTSEGEITCS